MEKFACKSLAVIMVCALLFPPASALGAGGRQDRASNAASLIEEWPDAGSGFSKGLPGTEPGLPEENGYIPASEAPLPILAENPALPDGKYEKARQDAGTTRLIVKYKASVPPANIASLSESLAANLSGGLSENVDGYSGIFSEIQKTPAMPSIKSHQVAPSLRVAAMALKHAEDVGSIIESLENDPNIEYVQEDFVMSPLSYPNDPSFDLQWGVKNDGQEIMGSAGVIGADINVIDVWDSLPPDSDVAIALVDTGIEAEHPDLAGLFIEGFDFTDGDSDVSAADGDPHGTQVAGIIGASHNLQGIAGVAPNIKIMPLKFISDNVGYTSDAINAIEYAKERGVRIINCSWGGNSFNQALYEAIAENPGILFVCAAGNKGGGSPVYPAAFGLPNILAVSSADISGTISPNASYGDYVGVYAPGTNVYTTTLNGAYGYASGTSFSAAFAAAASIYKQRYPEAIGADMAAAIRLSSAYCGLDEPPAYPETSSNAPMLDISAMLEILPGTGQPAPTEASQPLPDDFELSVYFTPYEELPEYIQSLLSIDPLYTDMSAEEKETLSLALGISDDILTECAQSGYHIYEAYIPGKIMQCLGCPLGDALEMIGNYGGDADAAALQAYILDYYKTAYLDLGYEDADGGLTELLIEGHTANEIGNAFIFAQVADIMDVRDAIKTVQDARSARPPVLSEYSSYEEYLIDNLLWVYCLQYGRQVLNQFNVIPAYDMQESLRAYQRKHNMYFDNSVHANAPATIYGWKRYNVISSTIYSDGEWGPWIYQYKTSSNYTGYSKHQLSYSDGYSAGGNVTVISKTNPGTNYICNSPNLVTARYISSAGDMYICYKYAATSLSYKRGATQYSGVESTSRYAYPDNNRQGSYWYVYSYYYTVSPPIISAPTIADKTVGQAAVGDRHH